jgi:hypothetical protein
MATKESTVRRPYVANDAAGSVLQERVPGAGGKGLQHIDAHLTDCGLKEWGRWNNAAHSM